MTDGGVGGYFLFEVTVAQVDHLVLGQLLDQHCVVVLNLHGTDVDKSNHVLCFPCSW